MKFSLPSALCNFARGAFICILGLLVVECLGGRVSEASAGQGIVNPEQAAVTAAKRIHELVLRCARPGPSQRRAVEELRALPPRDIPALAREIRSAGLAPKVRTVLEAALRRVQQRAITEARRQRIYRWYLSQTLDAYRRIGDRNPAWDADAEKSLLLFSRSQARPADAYGLSLLHLRVESAAIHALNDGCRDPLVEMIADLNPFRWRNERLWAVHRDASADLRALMASRYSSAIKLRFSNHACWRYQAESDRKAEAACVRQNLRLMARVVRHPNVPLRFLISEINSDFAPLAQTISGKHPWARANAEIFKAVDVTKPTPKLNYLYLCLKGHSYVAWAWRARGCGWANTVTQEGWKLFGQRLRIASSALQKAYRLNPGQPYAPREMMAVDVGLSRPRQIPLWFQRAMRANPDDCPACHFMIWALQGRWFGSADAMLAFGNWCLKYGHWKSGIPFFFLEALFHAEAHRQSPAYDSPLRITYLLVGRHFWRRPETWDALRAVFTGYYRHDPESVHLRGLYALLCMWSDHWKEALYQLHRYRDSLAHPKLDRFVQRFYFNNFPPPEYDRLACLYNGEIEPSYLHRANYSMSGLYREALNRVKHPASTQPWAVRRRRKEGRYEKWAADATVDVMAKAAAEKAPWSSRAMRAMHDEARVLAFGAHHRGDARDRMLHNAAKAVAEGCRSPLLLFYYYKNQCFVHGPDTRMVKLECRAASQLMGGAVPLTDRYFAACAAAQASEHFDVADGAQVGLFLNNAKQLLPQFLGDRHIPVEVRLEGYRKLWSAVEKYERSANGASAILAPLTTAGHPPRILHALMIAWDAEQAGLAALRSRTLQGVRDLSFTDAQRLLSEMRQSLAAYRQAWLLNPDCVSATNGAMAAQLWINTRNNAAWAIWPAHSTWLTRALDADPEDIQACRIGINFEAMCVKPFDGRDWWDGNGMLYQLMLDPEAFRSPSSPMLLVAIYGAQIILDHPLTNASPHQVIQRTFLQAFHAWRHIHASMAEYLGAHPDDERARSLYARVACELHHWKTAERQFQRLGNRARVAVFGGRKQYLKLKILAGDKAG